MNGKEFKLLDNLWINRGDRESVVSNMPHTCKKIVPYSKSNFLHTGKKKKKFFCLTLLKKLSQTPI